MSAAGDPTAFVLREAHVLDASGGFSEPVDVAVAGGRVVAVGPDLAADGAPSIDFSGLFVMPGVFDCHVHVAYTSLDTMEMLRTPITRWTLQAARNLDRTLRAGVTFVRDAAGADAGMRDAIAAGDAVGPRLSLSVVALTETGGHFDGFLPGPGLEMAAEYTLPDYPARPPFRVDGVENVRRAVREVVRAGADWVKVCATGGIASDHDDADLPQFTFDELAVAVDEAARKGRGVMAHAFGGVGLDDAVAAGVTSIEHGIFLTEEQAAAMADRGTWLVPTLAILRDVLRWADEPGRMPERHVRKLRAVEPRMGDAVRIAREHGVKMALGTDFVVREQHGRNLEELVLMHEAGLTAEETLLAATINGAELCGVADTHGRIAPGYVFDALVLDEDPTKIALFGRGDAVRGVFKGGEPVVAHPRVAGVLPGTPRPQEVAA
jgi:imidazolonepropionase-like amidohydrolase